MALAIAGTAAWAMLSPDAEAAFADAMQGTYDCNLRGVDDVELVIDESTLTFSGPNDSWVDRYTWTIEDGGFSLAEADGGTPGRVVVESDVPATLREKFGGTAQVAGKGAATFELNVTNGGEHFELDVHESSDGSGLFLNCDRRG